MHNVSTDTHEALVRQVEQQKATLDELTKVVEDLAIELGRLTAIIVAPHSPEAAENIRKEINNLQEQRKDAN